MDISKEEFAQRFQETVDVILTQMAEHPEVAPEKFYNVACMLENLAYFSPVLYEALRTSKKA